ncbi:tyrosine--tRNA ligase [Alphaproteobacteria bacterium endosymbiont of Tiliacea citrago]|uniref:tyrosine--tRNA ligase n=1 Tax=Alphaproteobacteria bacterium endosymbiont of Tiliacea citrago TaxID=3077944 RepID=UPI00313D73A2
MSVLQKILQERDLLSQISNENVEVKKIYAGFDGTARSLQIGNLTPLAALKHLSKAGIQPIVLLGGATSTVGDPSGKNTTRKQLDKDDVNININILESQIKKLLPGSLIVNNYDWISKLSFMDFLDQVATFLSVSYVIKFKTFADRLANENPLTIKEILYPLMQGYDFLYLFENEGCDAQLGGHDQWCNVLTGVDLIQKKHSKDTNVVAVTSPLLVDSNGNKMGKSLAGAIYLSEELCSVYNFWSFWRNVDDSLVKTCLLRFSDFEIEEINDIVLKDINQAKIKLANYMTTWVHSEEKAAEAQKKASSIFVDRNFNDLIETKVNHCKLSDVVSELKNISSSEAKRLIKSNSVKINEEIINDSSYSFKSGTFLISIGKKSFFKLVF